MLLVLSEFVTYSVVERLDIPVMPGLAWRDKRLNRFILPSPFLERTSDELGAVIHPDHPRAPALVKASKIEQLDHGARVDFRIDREGRVLASVFIDNVADLDRFAMPG